MAQTIEIGTLLVKSGTQMPESVQLESDPYLKGWKLVKNLSSSGMDRKLCEVGWTFFYMAGEVNAMAFGSDSEKTTRRAVKKVIANMKSDRFNCLEISRVAAKSFLGLPYVTVAAHAATYSGKFISLPRQTHSGMGSSEVGGHLNRSAEFAQEGIMSARNGDKARFGRLRKQKILLRKRIREMRDAMENKTTGTAIPGCK